MATKEDIQKLLAAGFPVVQVAEMLRLKEQFINALLKDPKFAAEVDKSITKRAMSGINRDDRLDDLHDRAIDMLEENIDRFESKPAMILKAFSVINSAKKERDLAALRAQGNGLGNGARVVNIVLPSHLMVHAVHHEVNANNEVVIVEDKPMVTMDSKAVAALMNKAQDKLVEDLDNSFRINGREFTLADLDLFGNEEAGKLNESLNNLDLLAKRRADAARVRRGESPVDIEEAEYYTEMIGTVPSTDKFSLPEGCIVFNVTADGEPRDEEEWIQGLFDLVVEANQADGITKTINYTSGVK